MIDVSAAWTEAIADGAQQVARGEIAVEAAGVDPNPLPLRDKMVALYAGWPDEWDGHSPGGVILTDYRGDAPHPHGVIPPP
ncbi:hypothetical protein [Actinomadura yumaensis]|uniref:Uncharacterized protein n=1 Tax=Actinomadura yumaensis TaxID=111807 RepID=A0ABW2CBZ8_9ACTN